MEQIYYSENCNIAYDSESVIVNGKPISADERGKFSPEEYALTKMRETYRSVLSRQYENGEVKNGAEYEHPKYSNQAAKPLAA